MFIPGCPKSRLFMDFVALGSSQVPATLVLWAGLQPAGIHKLDLKGF